MFVARRQSTSVHRPAVKFRQPQVAIEAHPLGESVACGGIERARQFHFYSTISWRREAVAITLSSRTRSCLACAWPGAESCPSSISSITGRGRRSVENLVENAVGKLALGHLGQFDGCGSRQKCRRVGVGVDAHALAGHIVHHNRVGALLAAAWRGHFPCGFRSQRQNPQSAAPAGAGAPPRPECLPSAQAQASSGPCA